MEVSRNLPGLWEPSDTGGLLTVRGMPSSDEGEQYESEVKSQRKKAPFTESRGAGQAQWQDGHSGGTAE